MRLRLLQYCCQQEDAISAVSALLLPQPVSLEPFASTSGRFGVVLKVWFDWKSNGTCFCDPGLSVKQPKQSSSWSPACLRRSHRQHCPDWNVTGNSRNPRGNVSFLDVAAGLCTQKTAGSWLFVYGNSIFVPAPRLFLFLFNILSARNIPRNVGRPIPTTVMGQSPFPPVIINSFINRS